MNHSVLILTGRAFQIFGPSNLRLLVTHVTLFLLGIFKFNLHRSQVTWFLSFFSNISSMKLGFKSLSVWYILVQRNLSRRMIILYLPDFFNNCSYELTQSFSENLGARLCKLSVLSSYFSCESIHISRQ